MITGRIANSLNKILLPISMILLGVGAVVLAAMMFLTASDVTLRQFKLPIMGTDDITAFLMAILISFGLAYCTIKKGHVQVDFLVERLPIRAQAIINSVVTLLSLVLSALITWQSFANMISVFQSGATSWTLNFIVYPFAGIVAFGFALFTLVLMANLFEAISLVRKR
jgi:TRAP-type C4-dicarboxylate transport system permease small subunit